MGHADASSHLTLAFGEKSSAGDKEQSIDASSGRVEGTKPTVGRTVESMP